MSHYRVPSRMRLWVSLLCASVLISTLALAEPAQGRAAATQAAPFTRITASAPARRAVPDLKVMNYYPANHPWTAWWQNYDHNTVYNDFFHIAGLGANTVRIIVHPLGVGWPLPTTAGAAELHDAIDTAGALGLSVQLTLFDWWNGYTLISQSLAWMDSLLAPYRDDNRIVLVEPQNEVHLSDAAQITWARAVLARLPADLPGVPRTISAYGDQGTAMMQALTAAFDPSLLDVIDTHLYGSQNSLLVKIAAARAVAAGRPVFAGELGMPTDTTDSLCSRAAQLSFYQRAFMVLAQNDISAVAPWTFTDFLPASMPAIYVGTPQPYFGLRTLDGSYKPAASAISTGFANSAATARLAAMASAGVGGIAFDSGFECDLRAPSDNTGLDAWALFDPADAVGAGVQAGAGVGGGYAGYLQTTSGNPTVKVPSLMHRFALLAERPVTVTAQTRLVAATGTTLLSIAWFAGSRYLGHAKSSAASLTSTAWQPLTLTATPPAGATSFQLHLRSASNAGTAYFDTVTVRS